MRNGLLHGTFPTLLAMAGVAGCQHTCQRPASGRLETCPTTTGAAYAPCNPLPDLGRLRAYPAAPQPQGVQPAWPDFRGSEPPPVGPAQSGWRPPSAPGVRLLPPETSSPSAAEERPRLRASENGLPPSPKPSGTEEPPVAAAFPVGIPGFATAMDQVATGLKPAAEGLDWLKENGYRTVVQLRQPGENGEADRQAVEKAGLRYVGLEVPIQPLKPETVTEFNRLVGDAAARPLFMYDKDGTLTGGLWYLHYRLIDRLPDEQARSRAVKLGLRTEAVSEQPNVWLAIQKYASEHLR